MRIAGVNIPDNKALSISLMYIYGVGKTRGCEIAKALNIDPNKRVKELSEKETRDVVEYVTKNYVIEGDLRREVASNIKFYMDLGNRRGLRHRAGLPVHGQRTHTNARTRKGKAVAIAGKKKVN